MGWDHGLICMDCKEILSNIARNRRIYRDSESLDNLENFLVKHGDHNLLFEADDIYSRCPGGTYWKKEESEKTKEISDENVIESEMKRVSSEILSQTIDIDPKIAEMIDKEFWNLVDIKEDKNLSAKSLFKCPICYVRGFC